MAILNSEDNEWSVNLDRYLLFIFFITENALSQLYILELKALEFHHFPSCNEIASERPNANFVNLVPILIKIQQQFKKRFTDFDTLMKNELIIFNNPKGCKIEDQEIYYRVELCNLQADPFVLARNEYGQEFFKLLSEEKYPKLVDLGLKISSIFGFTITRPKEDPQ